MAPQRKRPRRPAVSPQQSPTDANDDDEVTFRVEPPPAKRARLVLSKLPPSPPPPPEPRRSPNGFILPDPLPEGHGLVDNVGEGWTIGKSIGLGGFGEIYAARRCREGEEEAENFVVKVEPHTNGPLFTEIAFYLKSGKTSQIDDWKRENKVQHLGIAHFVSSGSLVFNEKKFRFLVLPRYGVDLQSVVDSSAGRFFSPKTACSMALQVVNTLEFIHSRGYIHKDIKGSNLLLGIEDAKKIFLVDFGLCSRFIQNDLHKPYRPDRRWAHEGTMEYTSRDSHLGCFSRRGDLEVLFYNLIEWMGGRLPWDDMQDVKPSVIQQHKIKAFEDADEFLSSCFSSSTFPGVLRNVMNLVADLRFEEKPCYDSLRGLLVKAVDDESSAVFDEVILNVELGSRSSKRDQLVDGEKENEDPLLKTKQSRPLQRGRKKKKSKKSVVKKHVSLDTYERMRQATIRRLSEQSLRNPTPAMLEQMERMRTRSQRSKRSGKWRNLTPSSLTPAMEAIVEMKRSRINSVEVKGDESVLHRKPSKRKLQESVKDHRKSASFLAPEVLDPTEPKRKRVITRSKTVPILPTCSSPTKGTSSSFRDHVSHVVGAGLDLIHGISRSLFPSSFKKN